jgi:hypothetical protein
MTVCIPQSHFEASYRGIRERIDSENAKGPVLFDLHGCLAQTGGHMLARGGLR